MLEDDLAEAAGIFAGDGTFYKTQHGFVMEIRGPFQERNYYENYVAPIFSRVLNSKLSVIKRDGEGKILGIRKCTRRVKEIFHELLNFPIGRKENIVAVPGIVMNSIDREIWIAYLRGVFDTDGCVALTKNRKIWKKPIVDFGSYSLNHRLEIMILLKRLGFKCHMQKDRVRIGGWKPVKRFFEIIKPHNNLKLNKWHIILDTHAGVA